MTQINAYLNFNGNCREAMTFYQSCFGGELTLQTIGESPMANQWPADSQQHILHASLLKESLVLLGSDAAGSNGGMTGNAVTLSLTCSTEEEMATFFERLAVGGSAIQPLHKFFAGTIGELNDKYGLKWMFYCANNQ